MLRIHWSSFATHIDYGAVSLEPRPTEGRTKSLFVCFCPFGIFFRNWSYYFFLIFCTIFDNRSIWKLTELPGKFIFVQIWAKGPKVDFWIFWKILSLVFFGNNLKWKLILLLIFHHQSQVYFWHAGKHRSFLQVDTIILSVRNQGCSKHSK